MDGVGQPMYEGGVFPSDWKEIECMVSEGKEGEQ